MLPCRLENAGQAALDVLCDVNTRRGVEMEIAMQDALKQASSSMHV